jgi:hypothetical protein
MQRRAASARAASGSAEHPIHLTTSGSNSSHSDSESAAASDASDVAEYGFRHYGYEDSDQNGFSDTDGCSSEDEF